MKMFTRKKIAAAPACATCGACQKAVHRSDEEKEKLMKKLRVIAGQVRGVEMMVHDDVQCHEILIQISAIENSLKSLGVEMLRSHLKVCVAHDIQHGDLDSIDEVVNLMCKLDL